MISCAVSEITEGSATASGASHAEPSSSATIWEASSTRVGSEESSVTASSPPSASSTGSTGSSTSSSSIASSVGSTGSAFSSEGSSASSASSTASVGSSASLTSAASSTASTGSSSSAAGSTGSVTFSSPGDGPWMSSVTSGTLASGSVTVTSSPVSVRSSANTEYPLVPIVETIITNTRTRASTRLQLVDPYNVLIQHSFLLIPGEYNLLF